MTRIAKAALCISAFAVAILLAAGGSKASEVTAPRHAYNIAAQPLDAALNAFIQASGTQVFYETALTAGLSAKHVKGQLTSEAALFELLSGTGLIAQRTDLDAFAIMPVPRGQAVLAAAVAPGPQFTTALQSGVVDALCRSMSTRPGAYKVAIELWIAPTGVVQRSALVGSTGDAGRDRALIAALTGVPIGMAPPPNSPQPFILGIGARAPGKTGDCQG